MIPLSLPEHQHCGLPMPGLPPLSARAASTTPAQGHGAHDQRGGRSSSWRVRCRSGERPSLASEMHDQCQILKPPMPTARHHRHHRAGHRRDACATTDHAAADARAGGGRLTHTLRPSAATRSKRDESTPPRRARPKGLLGAEVWLTLIDAGQPAPTDRSALAFLTMATKPSIRADFRSGDGGKTAVYMTRWVNTQGEKGPWSEIAMATVAA